MVDEIVVGFEDAVGEPVVAHKLPDVFDRIELGAFWRQRNDGDICGHEETGRQVPASLIDQEDGMGSGRNRFGDLCKMQVHRLAVAGRQDQGRALALLGADRAEDIGGSGTLVARRTGAGAALRPAASDFVLLADAPRRRTRFLLYRSRCPSRARPSPDGWGNFFKILDRARRLSVVARPGREFAVAHGPELPAECLLGDRDTEFLKYPLRQIDQPPAHHAVDRRDRTTFDHAGKCSTLTVVELGWLPRRLAVQETIRPSCVEA